MKAIYQWVIKTMMKDQTGVMRTLPKKDLVDFNVAMTAERLMRNGVDPNSLKNANQVENALNMIDNRPKIQEGITSTKSAKIMDLEGKEIDPRSKIMGGKQAETEAEIAERLSRENKETVGKIKNRQKMLDDAIDDASPGFSGDRKVDAELVAENLAERMGKVYDDLPTKERLDLYEQAFQGLTKKRFDPDGMATGGRAGFKDGPDQPGRRKFMKIMGGLATLPILGKFVKPAMPLIKKGAELSAPALDKIIEVVMSAGKLVSQSGRRLKELTTKKKLKDIEVEEDMMDGPSYTIKTKDKTIYYRPGRQDEGGLEDDIIEVIEDTVTKKAGGGIARMLGE